MKLKEIYFLIQSILFLYAPQLISHKLTTKVRYCADYAEKRNHS